MGITPDKLNKIFEALVLESVIATMKISGMGGNEGEAIFNFFRALVRNGCPTEAITSALAELARKEDDK